MTLAKPTWPGGRRRSPRWGMGTAISRLFAQPGLPIMSRFVLPIAFAAVVLSFASSTVARTWTDRQGEGYALHYSVQVGDETYYLHFDSRQVQWWLDEVIVE